MDKIFKVNVNKTSDFEFNSKQIEELNVVKEEEFKYHILNNNQAIKAELKSKDFDSKLYTIAINSNTYHVKIANPLDQLVKDLGFSLGNTKKLNDIKAPMPGIIIGIDVKVGDEVKEGDTLLVLEAMKMENAITSPKDAKVKSIQVKTSDTVEKNKLLVELE